MIEQFKTMVSESHLTKAAAVFFLTTLLLACVVIASYQMINGIAVNPIVLSILSVGIGSALSVLGINQGVMLQPLVPKTATKPIGPPEKVTLPAPTEKETLPV